MMELYLYGKADCCLCDRLAELLTDAMARHPGLKISLTKRDITTSAQWQQVYGSRIPVLYGQGQVLLEGRPSPRQVDQVVAALVNQTIGRSS